MSETTQATTNGTAWLANKTQRPIHIMQRGRDEDGNNLANIRLSTMGAVQVAESTLKLAGVAQLLKKKSVVLVTEAQAKKLNKAHDAVVSQPEPEATTEEEDDGDDD
ncbi:MAG TPA: hypothetical protein VGL07_17955 [Buttiauxella sp.]